MNRYADWHLSSGGELARELQALLLHLEHRDIVAAGIYNEKPAIAVIEHDGTLTAQPGASAVTSGRNHSGGRQHSIGPPMVNHDLIGAAGIRHGVYRADKMIIVIQAKCRHEPRQSR